MNERQTYVNRISILLERFAEVVESMPDEQMDQRAIESGSTPAVIVAHVVGSITGSALGIAGGRDVYRSRDEEFQAVGTEAAELAGRLRALARDVEAVLGAEDGPDLGEVVLPSQALLGLQQQREMERREPVVGAIAHAAEHLGELQLIRDLLAQRG